GRRRILVEHTTDPAGKVAWAHVYLGHRRVVDDVPHGLTELGGVVRQPGLVVGVPDDGATRCRLHDKGNGTGLRSTLRFHAQAPISAGTIRQPSTPRWLPRRRLRVSERLLRYQPRSWPAPS